MSLNNKIKQQGFTIVELLIVIVVIGILAAIVIVAYNGVQTRARDTNNKTDAVSIAKVAEAINADNGAYPFGTTDATLRDATAGFASGSTAKLPSNVTVTYLAAAGVAPTNAAATTAADLAVHTYTVKVCAVPNGLVIYYPSRSAGVIQTQTAGAGC